MFRLLSAAAIASATMLGAAHAATMSGIFDVTVVNVTNLNSTESQATLENGEAAFAKANGVENGFGGDDSVAIAGNFTFEGAIDFGTFDGSDQTTIQMWLDSSVGSSTTWNGTDLGGTILSKDGIGTNPGSATTSFFFFELVDAIGATDFVVTHDDGFAIYDGDDLVGGKKGPTSKQVTEVLGFDGGMFSLLYVATNGDPSVLNINATPVPLPAGLPLLLAGLGGLAVLRRRQKA